MANCFSNCSIPFSVPSRKGTKGGGRMVRSNCGTVDDGVEKVLGAGGAEWEGG